jgi:hypothetical protein
VSNPILRLLVITAVVLTHLITSVLSLFGYQMPIERWYQALKEPHCLPWLSSRTPRLYVYSKTDKLVPLEKVWQHGEDARRAGVGPVLRVVFDQSGHVAHARADPARYWEAVASVWEEAG